MKFPLSVFSLLAYVLCDSDSDSDSDSSTSSGSSTSSASSNSKTSTTSISVKQVDIEFLTKLVSDVKAHLDDYGVFQRTNDDNIPPLFTTLAYKLTSYTDDSYTTLLENPDFDITTLEQFATKLGWYDERLSVSGLNPKTLKDSNLGISLQPSLLGMGIPSIVLGFNILGLF